VIAAAAHVRTLTIPVLANGTKPAAARGVLARWRRSRDESPEPDGCDPAVFGEQISTYLREAAAERAQLEQELLEDEPVADAPPPAIPAALMVVDRAPIELNVLEPVQRWTSDPIVDELAIELDVVDPVQPWRADSVEERPIETDVVDPVQPWRAEAVDELPIELNAVEPVQRWTADPIDSTSELEDPLIDLSEELAGLSDEGDTELFDGDPVGVYTIALEADESAVEAVDLSPSIEEPATVAHVPLEPAAAELLDQLEPAAAESLDLEPAIETMFAEPAEPPRADIEQWVPMYLSPGRMWPALEGMPAESPAPRTEQPDWIELVASLRQDLERRGARPSDGASAETQPRVRKPRSQPRKAKPVQDEWGFFDPEQCGFSTLLAKLEEITEEVRP
jgi:hypothetical protein